MKMQTLGDLDQQGDNNFDLIRFCAASLVIFSHSYLITNQFSEEPLHKLVGFLNFGSIAVFTFFTISGYLITKSIFKKQSLKRFVWARILRIFPALTISSFFCALIVGPAITSLSIDNYLTSVDVYRYGFGNATLLDMVPFLPGVFKNNDYPGYINSPIWTLKGEILMYISVFFLGCINIYRSKNSIKREFPLIIVVFIYVIALQLNYDYVFKSALPWILFFMLGVLVYALRRYLSIRISYLIILWGVVLILMHLKIFGYKYYIVPALVYGIFVISYHPSLQMGKFSKYGDFSYGLYIYAFPIQQILMTVNPDMTTIANFSFSYAITFPIAVLSWHFVEKPALGLKDIVYFNK